MSTNGKCIMMTRIIMIFLILISMIQANTYDQPYKPYSQQKDKKLHIVFFAGVSIIVSNVAYEYYGIAPTEAALLGFVTAIIIGGSKELFYDTNGDWGDMGANVIGGAVGAFPVWIKYKF